MVSRETWQVVDGDEPLTLSATAVTWPVRVELQCTREDHPLGPGVFQSHLTCERCGQSVMVLVPHVVSGGYVRTLAELASDVLRHVREVHCDGGGRLK